MHYARCEKEKVHFHRRSTSREVLDLACIDPRTEHSQLSATLARRALVPKEGDMQLRVRHGVAR